MKSSLIIFAIGLSELSVLSAAGDWCTNYKTETLREYECDRSFTKCKLIVRGSEIDLNEPMTNTESQLVKGGDKYDQACGDLAAYRISICKAFKEQNPDDTSSKSYKTSC